MHERNEEQLMLRDALHCFVEKEIKPKLLELERGDMSFYDAIRTMLTVLTHGRIFPYACLSKKGILLR